MIQGIKLSSKSYILILILFAGLAFRLQGIGNPVLENGGNWREADTATIARNYFMHGYNFLYPEIDYNGYPGYVQAEFPLVPFIVSIIYGVIGSESLAAGRLVSVAFALASVFFLYKLGALLFGRSAGLWASFFYAALPLGVYFTRTIQPDSAMMFFMIAGVYCFMRWIINDSKKHYIASMLFIALMLLVKINTLFIGLLLMLILLKKHGWKSFGRMDVWVFAAVTLFPSLLWYWHSYRLLALTGNTFFDIMDKIGGPVPEGISGFRTNPRFYSRIIFARFGREYLLYSGFIFFVAGFFKRFRGYRKIVYYWLISYLIYMLIFAQAHWVHIHYLLPVSLPVFLVIGGFLKDFSLLKAWDYVREFQWKNILIYLLLILMVPVGIHHRKPYYEYSGTLLRFCEDVREITGDEDLIITDVNNPACLYQTGRKGFTRDVGHIGMEWITSCRERGATYFFTSNIRKLQNNINLYQYIKEKTKPVLKTGRLRLFKFD